MSSIVVDRSEDGSLGVLTFNRPKQMNALNMEMMQAFAEALEGLYNDATLKCLVITGSGGNFCAGIDLSAAKDVFNGVIFKDYMTVGMSRTDPVFWLNRMKIPTIACVEGVCITAGFEIALACDMIIASDKAIFQDTHAKFGIAPFWGLSQRLSRLIGSKRASEVSLAARPLPALKAERWGLVNECVPAGEALKAANKMAGYICKNPPAAVQRYKKTLKEGFETTKQAGERIEFDDALAFYSSKEFQKAAQVMAASKTNKPKPKSKL
jgi:enoyl-CoA hydratase/carnithine racemase